MVVTRKLHLITLFKILDPTSPHFQPFFAALPPYFLPFLPHLTALFAMQEKCGTALLVFFITLKHCPWCTTPSNLNIYDITDY